MKTSSGAQNKKNYNNTFHFKSMSYLPDIFSGHDDLQNIHVYLDAELALKRHEFELHC